MRTYSSSPYDWEVVNEQHETQVLLCTKTLLVHWRIDEKYLSVRHVRFRQPAPVPQQALACELQIAMGVGPTKVRSLKLQAFLLSSDVLLATATTFSLPVVTSNG